MSAGAVPAILNGVEAKLPRAYEDAVNALAECSRIDECQQWADKAEALASYAKQADDDSLRKYADRIQARAIRRCGELLKQVEPAQGARTDIEPCTGADTKLTRGRAATDAGLSKRQKDTALRVASVPETEFVQQVESDNPPTITELAKQGTKQKLVDLDGRSPQDFKSATAALAQLQRFAEFTSRNDPQKVAAGVMPHEIKRARAHVATVDAWLDRFVISLGEP